MSRLLALAATELRLLARNRTAAVTAVIMPSALSCFWLLAFHARTSRQWAGVIALQIGVVLAFGVYITAANTMVARRHGLVLKRLRTSEISQPALLLGTIALTPSPERAQIATMPLAFILLGGAIALTQISSETLRQALVAIPGTAIGQLPGWPSAATPGHRASAGCPPPCPRSSR